MRHRTRLIGLLAVLASACGSDPIAPTAPAPLPPPVADVHPLGNLSWECAGETCTYRGTLINAGPNCATAVRGVTRIFDGMNKELESQQWSVPNTLRLAEQVIYAGCCFRRANLGLPGGTYRTDVFSTPTRCE